MSAWLRRASPSAEQTWGVESTAGTMIAFLMYELWSYLSAAW